MKPALSKEEWAEGRTKTGYTFTEAGGDILCSRYPNPWVVVKDRYVMAAICLHGQPFGFTREDVSLIRNAAQEIYSSLRLWKDGREVGNEDIWGADNMEQIKSLADRIEALLPPEEAS